MTIRELLKLKGDAKAKAEAIMATAESAKRKLNEEEVHTFDAMIAEVSRIDEMIAKAQQLAAFETSNPSQPIHTPVTNTRDKHSVIASKEYSDAFYAYVRQGQGASLEFRMTLNEGSSPAGGYLVPTELDSEIVKKAKPLVAMRQLARVTTTGGDHNIVVRNVEAACDWTAAAIGGGSAPVTSPTFAGVTLKAHKLAAYVLIDNELMHDSFYDLPGELSDQFARAFGAKEESGFCIGTGDAAGQPDGVFPNAATGKTTAAATAITADELMDVFHALNPAYRPRASWVMADATALLIRKLKFAIGADTIGYCWQPSLQAGVPDMLLGRPVVYSVYAPAVGSGNVPIVFGDFYAGYRIADRVPRTFQRLNELYAINDQTAFVSTQRVDGAIVLAEAITSLKCHV